ncbi:MAG: hypothetical protein NTV34_19550 [Proteobacteria bacterium]|nr:hypothetical protein [Pseudomonadota bacterium]
MRFITLIMILLSAPARAAGPLPVCFSEARLGAENAAHENYPKAELVSLTFQQQKPVVMYSVLFQESGVDQPIAFVVKLNRRCAIIDVTISDVPARLPDDSKSEILSNQPSDSDDMEDAASDSRPSISDTFGFADSHNHDLEQYCCTRVCGPRDGHFCRYIPRNKECSPGPHMCK